jgi:hypothetical protein
MSGKRETHDSAGRGISAPIRGHEGASMFEMS